MKIFCQIYKSVHNTEMYLYVEKTRGLEDVPDALMKRFGDSCKLMTLMLEPGRKLARANVDDVMREIADKGFYLQMPPTAAELYRREGSEKNG